MMKEDNKNLLGKSFSCDCGKEHRVPTKTYFYGDDCYDSLREVIEKRGAEQILVVADKRTHKAAGMKVLETLPKDKTTVYIIEDPGDESPAADDVTKDRMLEEAPEADLYVSVGSGVVNDLVKWVSFAREKPFLTVPTAASMNGYASANVAAAVDGLKVLFHAKACESVHVDPQVLIDAPFELTTSGLGDVLAKSVSSADWKLNHYLFDEYYCQFSVDLLKELEPVYLNNPEAIRKKERGAMKALFEALFYSSIAMTITGTSSPASGGEHLISHTLDMLAMRDHRAHDLHGRQVGVASILMAALYERVMALEVPVINEVPVEIDREFWGTLTPIVEKEYKKKRKKISKAATYLADRGKWEELKSRISPSLVSPEKLKNCLKMADGAHRFYQIRDNGKALDRNKFLQVVLCANQMRERFTILDLAMLTGVLPESLEELVDTWIA